MVSCGGEEGRLTVSLTAFRVLIRGELKQSSRVRVVARGRDEEEGIQGRRGIYICWRSETLRAAGVNSAHASHDRKGKRRGCTSSATPSPSLLLGRLEAAIDES